jgi:hypothetical protein
VSLSHADLRRVFGAFPTGITAAASIVDGVPGGLAAKSFASASLACGFGRVTWLASGRFNSSSSHTVALQQTTW